MTEVKEKILEIQKKVSQNSLYINRIPKKTKIEFIDLAKEEFADDYGMAIKWLMDFRNGLLSNPNQILMEQVQVLTKQVEGMNQVPDEKKKRVIRSVSGRVISEKEE